MLCQNLSLLQSVIIIVIDTKTNPLAIIYCIIHIKVNIEGVTLANSHLDIKAPKKYKYLHSDSWD